MKAEQIQILLNRLKEVLPPEAIILDQTQGLERGFVDVRIKSYVFVIEFGDGNEVGVSRLRGDASDWLSGHEFVVEMHEVGTLVERILGLESGIVE